jgi:hypothetical protein
MVNESGDVYEREADAVANAVMQAKGADDHFFHAKSIPISSLQRSAATGVSAANPSTESYIESLSGGRALSKEQRSFFEPRLGHDLSQVRLHTSHEADESSKSIGAAAYTYGNNVVFRSGQYEPETESGKG